MERFEVVNALDPLVLHRDLATLLRGRHFLWETFRRGRSVGTGRYALGEESLFLEDLERVLTAHERDRVTIINAKMLADKLGIGRTQLFAMFKRVPTARERFRQHLRRPSRH
jgi:hypothetical protein